MPPTGVTPTAPGAAASPGSVRSGAVAAQLPAASPAAPCLDEATGAYYPLNWRGTCPEGMRRDPTVAAPGGEVPLTRGRDLGVTSKWDVWLDVRLDGLQDRRFGLDIDNRSDSATLGIDRRFGDRVVAGISATAQKSHTEAFGDLWTTNVKTYTAGPYVAVQLSPNWAVDGSVSYSETETDTTILVLSTQSEGHQLAASANVHAQFAVDKIAVRPTVSLFYAHNTTDAHDLSGVIFGRTITLHRPSGESDYGYLETRAELTRTFVTARGRPVMPYAEFGVRYEFERPNGGEMLNSELKPVTPSAWSGSLRAGVRLLAGPTLLLDAGAGYLTFGQNGLNQWEALIHVSYGF